MWPTALKSEATAETVLFLKVCEDQLLCLQKKSESIEV